MHSSTPVIQRQWQIVISLMSRRQGQTVKELAEEVGVDDRTIRRDLNTLRKAGFPLEERVSDHARKHWKMVEGGSLVPIHFTWMEAVSLYLGRQLLEPLAGTYFWQSAQSGFNKIRAMLGEAALSQLEKVSKSFFQTIPGRSDYSEKAELIDRLMMGIEEHKVTFIEHQSERATEPVSLEVYPYGIIFYKNWLYLVADSRDHALEKQREREGQASSLASNSASRFLRRRPSSSGKAASTTPSSASQIDSSISADQREYRTFKIDRISEVDVQSLQFTPDPNFSLEKHFSNTFGVFRGDASESSQPQKVRVRFSKGVAKYVQEKTWHPSQKITKEKDGRIVFEVDLDDTHEFKTWIQSFGPRATVLEPTSLREEIINDANALLANYRSPEKVRKK